MRGLIAPRTRIGRRIYYEWTWSIALWLIVCVVPVRADFSADLANASRPIGDGVPEVAIARLQTLLQSALQPAEKRLANGELVRALVTAKRPADALSLIQENQLTQSSTEKFWQ